MIIYLYVTYKNGSASRQAGRQARQNLMDVCGWMFGIIMNDTCIRLLYYLIIVIETLIYKSCNFHSYNYSQVCLDDCGIGL